MNPLIIFIQTKQNNPFVSYDGVKSSYFRHNMNVCWWLTWPPVAPLEVSNSWKACPQDIINATWNKREWFVYFKEKVCWTFDHHHNWSRKTISWRLWAQPLMTKLAPWWLLSVSTCGAIWNIHYNHTWLAPRTSLMQLETRQADLFISRRKYAEPLTITGHTRQYHEDLRQSQ